jgi:hypothetical protein
VKHLSWVLLVALAFLAGFLRLEHQLEIAPSPLALAPQGDEHSFLEWAHSVAKGSDDALPYQAPLYPTVLGALERVGLDPTTDARLLQALLGLVAAGLAARIGFEVTRDRRVALVAFLLAAFARPLIHAEGTLLREAASATVLAAAALAYVRARTRGKLEDHAALGLALGLGLVLRENFAVVALAVLVERTAVGVARRERKTLSGLGILLVAAALPVLPFDLKVARLGGGVHLLPNWNQGCVFYLANRRDNPTQGGYAPPPFVTAANPEGEVEGFEQEARRRTGRELRGHEVGRFWLREGLQEVAAAPGLFLGRVVHRALATLAPFETAHQRDMELDARDSWVLRAPLVDMGVLIGLALVGIALAAIADKGERAVLLLASAWWVSLLVAAFTTRYRVPAIPLLAVLGALGARAIARSAATRPLVACALLAPVLLVQGLRFFRAPEDHTNAQRTRGHAGFLAAEETARKGRPDLGLCLQAIYDLETVLAANPGDAPVRLDLAHAYLLLAKAYLDPPRPVLARQACISALEKDPGLTIAWKMRGVIELSLRRPQAAVEAFSHADANDPDVQRLLVQARELTKRAADRPLPNTAR